MSTTERYTDAPARRIRMEGLEKRIATSQDAAKFWNDEILRLGERIKADVIRRDHWLHDIEAAKELLRQIGAESEF